MKSIDTNILLRHLLQNHDDHSPRASALLLRARTAQERIFCPATVIFEAIHVLHGLVKLPRADIAWALTNLVQPDNFELTHQDVVIDALGFWTKQPSLDYADCFHLALTRELGMTEIYTFDKKMDRYSGVTRIEP